MWHDNIVNSLTEVKNILANDLRLCNNTHRSLASDLLCLRMQDCPDSLIEYVLQALLREGRALKVLHSANILRHSYALAVRNRRHTPLTELLNGNRIFTQIQFGANQDQRRRRGMMRDFRPPFGPDVLETRRTYEREADEEDVGLGVRQGPESVIILLTGRIPKSKRNRFPVHHHIGRVIVKYSWDVLSGERVRSV